MPRTISRRFAMLATASAGLASRTAVAQDNAVELQLVLAVDVSGSVTRARFELQRDGYAAAFRSNEVQAAIANTKSGAIAITMSQWTGPALQRIAVPWTRVASAAGCQAFAAAITEAPRQLFSGGTSISGAIDHARLLLNQCPFRGARGRQTRQVIDVSGDGENNRGRLPEIARDEAASNDITINGLPITLIEPQLDAYYRDHVIGGPGAFMVVAESYEQFADAVRRKLVQEIA
jgi:hypothetical protein